MGTGHDIRRALGTLIGLLVFAALASGCAGSIEGAGDGAGVSLTPQVQVRVRVVDSGEMQPVALTRAAADRQRQRDHHATLVASRPTPVPTPTVSAQRWAALHVSGVDTGQYGSVDPPPEPGRGVWWYRDEGGDHTGRAIREANPHWVLFEGNGQVGRFTSFGDGSMQKQLGRLLAGEVYRVMPEVGPGNSALAEVLTENLGWELVSAERPLVRLWSGFTFRLGDEDLRFVVGGVMALEVRMATPGGEYLEAGHFEGPVLLERHQ